MENKPISMSGFSESGKKTLDNLSANPMMYSNFLKMQGRMFKFPTSVALEFFSHSEKIDCIATEGQWINLGYRLKNSAEAVRFIDSKGTIHSFYDFSQIENAEYFPKRWEVTQENVAEVKDYLRSNYNISDGNPNSSIISMMLYCTNIFLDSNKCMEALKIPDNEKADFFRSYVNAFSIIVAGRLEVNAVQPFNITPDMSFINKLERSEDKLLFLSYAGKTAREALKIIENAVTFYEEKRREKPYELRELDEIDIRTEVSGISRGIADNSTQGSASTGIDRSDDSLQSGNATSRSELEETDRNRENRADISILENQTELASQGNNDVVRVQPGEQHILPSDNGLGAVNGRGADRDLWSEMDSDDGGTLLSGNGDIEISAQVLERSEGSTENGRELPRDTGEAIRGEQPTSDRLLRSDSTVGENEAVRNGQPSDEGSNITSIHSSDTGEVNHEQTPILVTADRYKTENISFTETAHGTTASIEIDDSITSDLLQRLDDKGYVLSGTIIRNSSAIDVSTLDKKLYLDTDFEYWNEITIRDNNGNYIKSVKADELLAKDEIEAMYAVIKKITPTTITPEEAIHNAFSEFINNHSFSDKQKEFFDRVEKTVIENNITEDFINSAYNARTAFRHTYGDRERVSRVLFNHSLTALENELERKIKENFSENSVKIAVSSQQESPEAIDVSSEETEGQEMAIAFNVPTIDVSLRNDFQSGKLSFSEVAAELHSANLIPHVNDYERVAEILGTEAIVSQLDATLDKYYINADTERVTQVSYNPDSSEGGQLVYIDVDFDMLREALESDNPMDYIYSNGETSFTDITDEQFIYDAAKFLTDKADFNNKDNSVIDELGKLVENAQSIVSRQGDEVVTNDIGFGDFVTERNLEAVEKIEVGDEITLKDDVYIVKSINGDFMMSAEKKNIDDSHFNESLKSFIGNWKKQLVDEAENTPIFVIKPDVAKALEKDRGIENNSNAEKEKSQELFSYQGLQLPEAINNLDFDNIIPQNDINVNTSDEENSEKSFSEQVDDVLAGKANKFNALKVCETPDLLIKCGCEQLPMLYTQRHLREALKPKNKHSHSHGLDVKQIKRLPELLENPVMIMDSTSTNDSIVVVTSEIDRDNFPVVISIKPNGKGIYELQNIDSNFITSVYGRGNFETFLNRVVESNNLLYYNKEKSQELFSCLGLQSSEAINNLDSNIIIHQSRNIVKANDEKNIENSVNNDAEKESEIIVEEKPKNNGNSYANRLYKLFTEQFPDIANGSHTYERYGKKYDEYGENDAYEPLSIEHLGGNRYGFMYWYVQNGDLMRDPDFTFELDHKNKELIIHEYQLDTGSLGSVYYNVFDDNGEPDCKLLASLNANFLQILKNNQEMKRDCSAYTTRDGEEVEILDEPSFVSVDSSDDTLSDEEVIAAAVAEDKSAEWREALNEYSRKHGLGELNLIPPPNTMYGSNWEVKEKMVDGSEVSLLTFNPYIYPMFTNDSLNAAFDDYDSKNTDTHEDNLTRKSKLSYLNGAITKLPEVRALPKIEYADKPQERIRDNIDALREMNRLEHQAANNRPLYKIEDKNNSDYNSYDTDKNPRVTKEQSDNILRKYYGWGGLSQVFDERYKNYENTRKEIKELIGEDGYAKARRSTLNAFYTPQHIIDAMYKAVVNMELPADSRVLEPSCGTGNFITRMPSRYRNAEITGVEIDGTTAKIASYLANDNKNVKILNMGYEKTHFENESFDLVIGNVPFGENKMIDVEYNKDLLIHDAFFRKSLDKVKKGGIVAFITTSGTLDKKNSKIREMLAEKADLVGAIRLPNNAFGGTGVTSDIIFLQKRENPLQPFDKKPDWCYTTLNEDGLRINSYFVDNPQMMLGKMEKTSFYDRLTCTPTENADLTPQLDEAIKNINAKVRIEKQERTLNALSNNLEPWGKNFTYQLKDDKIYYRMNNRMEEVKFKGSPKVVKENTAMTKALIEIRTAIRELIDKQKYDLTDTELVPLREKLNKLYDNFVSTYNENLTSPKVKKLFGDDLDYSLLAGLEEKKEVEVNGETVTEINKAPIFYKRTVNAEIEITAVNTEEEALQVSLDQKGKIDILYMATLIKSQYPDNTVEETAEIISDKLIEKGLVFDDPSKTIINKAFSGLVDRAEYLSGNVREKLIFAEEAAERNPEKYQRNIEALKEVIPEDIPAEEISVRMGCTWIDDTDYTEFLHELSGRTEYNRSNHTVHYLPGSASFDVENARSKFNLNVNETKVYGISKEYNMYRIAEALLNQKKVKVFYKDNEGNRITDHEATRAANKCGEKINEKFKEWIFKDAERKEKYVRRYNDIFNSIVGRTYDGSNLTFNGINNDFTLRPHQKNCIARAIYGGNTLAAHVVGAGKSAVMFSTVMKKKQLGLINKACIVVPKALVEQTADEWRKWYPDAKLLTVSPADLSNEKSRLLFASKVATGDYDGVVMAQQQFDKIGMTPEFIEEHKQRQIDELEDLKNRELSANNGVKTPSVKEIEKMIEKYEKELEALYTVRSKARGKDNLLFFEDLGFDFLVVDEAHAYKNGHFFTKMENVSGVSSSATGRSADMHLKTDYFNQTFGNGHILLATGTPVTNSMTELYVMTRYLRPDLLKQTNTEFFDSWASTFGNIVARDETGLDGKLQIKTSFSQFTNLPELMAMYKEFADIQSQEKLNLPRPELKGGKVQIVDVEASPEQKRYIQEIAERAKAIQSGNPIPRANGKEDCYPVLTNEAKILGLGNRVIKALYEKQDIPLPEDFVEDEYSKVDKCIDNVVEIYNRENNKGNNKAVQIIFSDVAVNPDNGNFSAYEYIKQQLIEKGIEENEIVFAPKSDAKDRADIFKKINEGTYRVVIASTQTLGTGANIQQNMYALHHLDIPWRPSDFEQREGRILRQGNVNKEVEIFNYVTKGTFDSYLYQTVLNKAKFISQILDNDIPARVCEDADEKVLSFGEIMAVAEGNPLFKKLASKKNELVELKMLYSRYQNETLDMKRDLPRMEENLQSYRNRLNSIKFDLSTVSDKFEIKDSAGKTYSESKDINEYLNSIVKAKWKNADFKASFKVGEFLVEYELPKYNSAPATFKINNSLQYTIELKSQPELEHIDTSLGIRLKNFFETGLQKRVTNTEQEIKETEMNIEQINERIEQPFEQLEYLNTLEAEVDSLTDEIYKEQNFNETSATVANKDETVSAEDVINYDDFDNADYNTSGMTM